MACATGTERYALQMLRALIDIDSPHDFTLYFRDAPASDLLPAHPRVSCRVIPFARAWTHFRLASALSADRPDILWVPAHTLPFAFRGRAAVTVHDLGFRHFPEAHPNGQRTYLELTTRFSAGRAAVIFADSRATAADLQRFYGTPPDRIRVVYPGVDTPATGDVARVRTRYGLPERYFLFLGTLQPRKNIARLVQAFSTWQRLSGDRETALVLAGAKGWLFDPAWLSGSTRVIITGFVDDSDKGALYAGALGFLFPSLYEGFGFPVLEAMCCGTPVLCSNSSSLPELVGDAALLVDPLEVESIADGIGRLASDSELREALSSHGRQQAASFTWQRAAAQVLAGLEQAAS